MKGSAQVEQLPLDELDECGEPSPETPAGANPLRREAAERLRAHRQRRARLSPQLAVGQEPAAGHERGQSKKDRIAAAVAERYAQTPTYRAFLAEEAQRATQQAAAAAEIAARNAEAVAAVQQELLAELELWTAPQQFNAHSSGVPPRTEPVKAPQTTRPAVDAAPVLAVPVIEHPVAGFTVRLYEDAGAFDTSQLDRRASVTTPASRALTEDEAHALLELEEEIAFRQAPVFDDFIIEPTTALPANLLEFPRQLVAARKARPRLAEGPLREDAPRSPQLRIFEVEADQVSTTPPATPAAPEWTNMRLDAQPAVEAGDAPVAAYLASPGSAAPALAPLPAMMTPEPAPLQLRLMAALVDLGLVLFAYLGCVAACVRGMHWLPSGLEMVLASGATLLVLYVGYVLLFFTLSDQTPGMRYARIGLCTFEDENPSRAAMRKRLAVQLLAALPLGIGLLWALLDDESLGWHDRMSRMYQRAY